MVLIKKGSVKVMIIDKKKRGYLEEQFRLFYLTDHQAVRFEPHFHDFLKILIHIKGYVNYTVNNRVYPMKPGDILFIPRYQVHHSEIGEKLYERYILWISEDYIKQHKETGILLRCFKVVAELDTYVFHPEPALFQEYLSLLKRMNYEDNASEYAASLYSETLLLQFLTEMNRLTLNEAAAVNALKPQVNIHIQAATDYINEHLAEDLSVEELAARLYISPSYLMHRFRQDTGLTLHQYILQKRLFAVVKMLKPGQSIGEAASVCGFKDYSTFFRAFKTFFGRTPQDYLKGDRQPLKESLLRE